MAALMVVLVRSTSTLLGLTSITLRVAGSIWMLISVSTRPKALALVTGTSRPLRLGRPVARATRTLLAAVLPVTSTVFFEQL